MPTELGYYFHPPEIPATLGHPELEVYIAKRPTVEHYDPSRAVVGIVTSKGYINQLTVRHPWHGPRRFRTLMGRITLFDRVHKRVEAFTLGGRLEIEREPEGTRCHITSPAPIFEIIEHSLPSLIVSEMEALIARQRAGWAADPFGYEDRLIQAKPFELYTALLLEIEGALEEVPSYRQDQETQDLLHYARQAVHALREAGRWPDFPSRLDDLLGKHA